MAKNNIKNEIDVIMGERVKKCRKKMCLSQEELASLVRNLPENNGKERTPQHIGYIERGDRKLSAEWAYLLSKVFNVRAEYLLCEDDFETDFHKKAFPVVNDFLSRAHIRDAVEKYSEVFGIKFNFFIEGIDTDAFKEKHKDKTTNEALSDDDVIEEISDMVSKAFESKNRKYQILDSKDNIIKTISEDEFIQFATELHNFFEFTFNKLIQ